MDTQTNRLGVPAGQAGVMSYDAAGNQTHDSYTGKGNRTYDAEHRQTSAVSDIYGNQSFYTYDASGKRVRRSTPTGQVWHIYGLDGELLAEYAANAAPAQPQKEYGYRSGELLVTAESGGQVNWLVTDHLGTPRIIADLSGSLQGIRRHDYLPFGEEVGAGTGGRTSEQGYVADNVRQKFAGSERDGETGLDFMQARYMSSMQGRFTSTDPLYLELRRLTDPQKFNIYVYARNNPLRFIDPNGLEITVKDKTTDGTGDDEYQRIVNGRTGANFQIGINSKNKVIIVDGKGNALGTNDLKALGKTLSGGEKELFRAITDTSNNATVNIVRNDPDIFHGAYEKKGENTIDVGDANKLNSSSNAGGRTAYDSIGHETLEAFYTVSKNIDETAAHQLVNGFFPGLGNPVKTGRIQNGQAVVGWRGDFPVAGRPNTYERTEFTYVTPIPASQYKNHSGKGVNIKAIEKVP